MPPGTTLCSFSCVGNVFSKTVNSVCLSLTFVYTYVFIMWSNLHNLKWTNHKDSVWQVWNNPCTHVSKLLSRIRTWKNPDLKLRDIKQNPSAMYWITLWVNGQGSLSGPENKTNFFDILLLVIRTWWWMIPYNRKYHTPWFHDMEQPRWNWAVNLPLLASFHSVRRCYEGCRGR